MNVKPKAATDAKRAWAVLAPRPERKPFSRPADRVRCMQMTPTGPTGAAMVKARRRPLRKRLIYMVITGRVDPPHTAPLPPGIHRCVTDEPAIPFPEDTPLLL